MPMPMAAPTAIRVKGASGPDLSREPSEDRFGDAARLRLALDLHTRSDNDLKRVADIVD